MDADKIRVQVFMLVSPDFRSVRDKLGKAERDEFVTKAFSRRSIRRDTQKGSPRERDDTKNELMRQDQTDTAWIARFRWIMI
jgi:hypothetical protein